MPIAYALIHHQDGVYGVSFPDYPGAISTGATPEDALRKGSEALSFHVAGMVADGDRFPMLRSLEELQADPGFRDDAAGAVVALVPFDLPAKAVRINVSMDERLLDAVDRAAKAAGQSRSAFLAEAARKRIMAA